MPATPVFDGVLSGAGSGQLELIIILVQASSRIGRQLSKREESKGGGRLAGRESWVSLNETVVDLQSAEQVYFCQGG